MNTSPPISSFIGRQSETSRLLGMLTSGARLVTLTGPGGIGKTRLSQETGKQAAAGFKDGCFFVALDVLTEPGQVLARIASVLTVSESGKTNIFDDLCAAISEKQILLVLDNCEHVLEAAPQLADLLAVCPNLQMLATSREALRLRGEQEFALNPLALPSPGDPEQISPAVQLFADRARAVNPGFTLDETNTPLVIEICSWLDGLPLAIELAAALLRLFSPQALLTRLKNSPGLAGRSTTMQLLVGGARDLPVRQQTLRAAIEWSYHLLEPAEQRLFRSLAVFSNGCSLEAAQALRPDEPGEAPPVLDSLIALADKNLLRAIQTNGEPRFGQLRTIQEFARERLIEQGELAHARRQHAEFFVGLAQRAVGELNGPERGAWLDRLDDDHDNFRAALTWSLEQESPLAACQLGAALWRFWFARALNHEGFQWLNKILARPGDVPLELKANVLNGAGGLALMCGEYVLSKRRLLECLELRTSIGDKHGMSASFHNLSQLAIHVNDYETALDYIRESLRLDAELGDRTGVASGLLSIGWILIRQHKLDEAEEQVKQGLAISQEMGDVWHGALSYSLLGDIAYEQERFEQARQYLVNSRAGLAEAGDLGQTSSIDRSLGMTALHLGDFHQAETLISSSIDQKFEGGDIEGVALCLEAYAYLAAARALMPRAARLWGAAQAIRKSLGAPPTDADLLDRERYIGAARAQLREKTFQQEVQAGEALNIEQAIRYAREPFTPASQSTGQTIRRSLPAGLTAREAEVLALVAQGLSDGEVAARLVLSPRTVNAHLTSIYNKLGVNSRAAATRFAVEQKLDK